MAINKKQRERWAPWALLVLVITVWQLVCTVFEVSEFIFPSPARIAAQTWEYKTVIAGHAWRTYWVTMAGFGIAIVVGVLLGFIVGSSRLADLDQHIPTPAARPPAQAPAWPGRWQCSP